MTKVLRRYITVLFLLVCCPFILSGQQPLWMQASDFEKSGNYREAIRIKKLMAKEDIGTEWYIDDIAGIARCFSYINENDSTLKYCNLTKELAEKLIGVSDSVAEEYIQSTAWALYKCGDYINAVNSAYRVLELRDKIYGITSVESIEWIGVMQSQARTLEQIEDVAKFCDLEFSRSILPGADPNSLGEAIKTIRGYAFTFQFNHPKYVANWIEPYYIMLRERDVLHNMQLEYEFVLLNSFLGIDDLESAAKYAQYLSDRVSMQKEKELTRYNFARVYLSLANYEEKIGNNICARLYVDKGWKEVEELNLDTSVEFLIDRHIIERQLYIDSKGNYGMDCQWLINTATSIINSDENDESTLAFFYESRAWAYEALKQYDEAVSNITKAIQLNPSSSREKKLAQLYMRQGEYNKAETILLNIIENDPGFSKLDNSVISDFLYLYWMWGNKEKLADIILQDLEIIKSGVKHAFAYMNDDERERYLKVSSMGVDMYYDIYTAFSRNGCQWEVGNRIAYDMALAQKGLLLATTREIREIMDDVPDTLKNIRDEYITLRKIFKLDEDESVFETDYVKKLRLRLMSFVQNHPKFLKQLYITSYDVQKCLKESEAAIEFINLWNITPELLLHGEDPNFDFGLGALILTKNEAPKFIHLTQNSEIEELLGHDDEGNLLLDMAYCCETQKQLYDLLYAPIQEYLDGITTIYYSPAGIVNYLNLDFLAPDTNEYLSNRIIFHRVSSTREILTNRNSVNNKSATLYGDIDYSSDSSTNGNPVSRYRSTTRAGFGKLPGTSDEIDSIGNELRRAHIPFNFVRKSSATEVAFRDMTQSAPKILHIATHGFSYNSDKIHEMAAEAQKLSNAKNSSIGWNFITFQIGKPSLYHSGLALAGAQNTWKISDYNELLKISPKSDGILLSAEIAKLNLTNVDLLIMSACESGLGKVETEGVYGLQRAFKLAGVNSIIMSLWKVDDDATQLLMSQFYKNYIKGMKKKTALLSAQKYVREQVGFEAPYNWAGWILLDALD